MLATTWNEIIAIEPRLVELEARAKALAGTEAVGNDEWQRIRAETKRFVGDYAGDERLADPCCYNVAIDHLEKCRKHSN